MFEIEDLNLKVAEIQRERQGKGKNFQNFLQGNRHITPLKTVLSPELVHYEMKIKVF